MIYLNMVGIAVLSILQVYKTNYFINLLKNREMCFKNIIKGIFGWVVGALFCSGAIILLYAVKGQSAYLQLADLLYTLLLMAITDCKFRIIPNVLTIALLLSQAVTAVVFAEAYMSILNILISVLILVILMLISRVSNEKIGMGDVKLIVTVNLIYGASYTMYTVMFALMIMVIYSIPLLIAKKLNFKSQLPFVPFYVIGVMIYTILNLI